MYQKYEIRCTPDDRIAEKAYVEYAVHLVPHAKGYTLVTNRNPEKVFKSIGALEQGRYVTFTEWLYDLTTFEEDI